MIALKPEALEIKKCQGTVYRAGSETFGSGKQTLE